MDENHRLAEQFETHRPHLRAVAYRMLGSAHEADDAVQESWLRLMRSGATPDNLRAWLTTIVSRVCLDLLRARRTRQERTRELPQPQPMGSSEQDLLLAESVGQALMIVLRKLSPAERVAYVLHDLFELPFEQIAPILERTPGATRQLANRARRRVHGEDAEEPADRARQRQVAEAFLAAARAGDLEALLAVLDPGAVFRADPEAVRLGGPAEIRGAHGIAAAFKGRAQGAQPVLINGAVGLLVAVAGELRLLLQLTLAEGRIAAIEVVADRRRLEGLDLAVLDR